MPNRSPEERLATLEAQMADVLHHLEETARDVRCMRTKIDKATGGWRVLIFGLGLMASGGVLGMILAKIGLLPVAKP